MKHSKHNWPSSQNLFTFAYIFRGVQLTLEIQDSLGGKAPFKDFKEKLYKDAAFVEKVAALKNEVANFARTFPLPGLPLL